MTKNILVTGGAGYIGSTISHYLVSNEDNVVIIDCLDTGFRSNLPPNCHFYEGRISDLNLYEQIRDEIGSIDIAIHCASYISVPESEHHPEKYISNNVSEFIEMLNLLPTINCNRLIFSSSASVYGDHLGAICENCPMSPLSVYAETKWLCEQISALIAEQTDLKVVNLRYFNPVGTHPDGSCGPGDINSGSLLNELTKSVIRGTPFKLTGTDFDTRDGSGMRDFIDVADLAEAHVKACDNFDRLFQSPCPSSALEHSCAINLGSGQGVTVRELLAATQHVLASSVIVEEADRRPGDVAGSYADTTLANEMLAWKAKTPLSISILRHINWWKKNWNIVEGFEEENPDIAPRLPKIKATR